jgi:hypothetical protein
MHSSEPSAEPSTVTGAGTLNHAVTTDIREALVNLFLTASEAVARRLHAAGIEPAGWVTETVIERDGPGSWRIVEGGRVWRSLLTRGPLKLVFEEAKSFTMRQCAARLADSAQTTLPFWAPLGSRARILKGVVPDSDLSCPPSDLAGWVEAFVLLPALEHHLAMLRSVDQAQRFRAR